MHPTLNPNLAEVKIAVAIPYYNAARHIQAVVQGLPTYIHTVVITNDCSPEALDKQALEAVVKAGTQLVFLENPVNTGVGGATMKGFQYAIDHDFDIVIKMDADNQMDPVYLPDLLDPLLSKKAEMCKGNRFRDLNALKRMPFARRMGNIFLSFLTKAATGYWNNFDPNNGYLALDVATLKQLDFTKLASRYFFETSLMAQMYFVAARIKDVPMPAIYGDEKSSMKLWHMPGVFASSLVRTFFKRIAKAYFLYDFNIGSLYLATGIPLFLFGVSFGIYEWVYYYSRHILAPTGTIMLVTLSIILGFQLLLQAIQYDIFNTPKAQS